MGKNGENGGGFKRQRGGSTERKGPHRTGHESGRRELKQGQGKPHDKGRRKVGKPKGR